MFRRTFLALAALAVGSIGTTLSGQCFSGPDNLNGLCWRPAGVILPSFPRIGLPGTGICWENCDPQVQVDTRMTLDQAVQVACGQYRSTLTVTESATGSSVLAGTLQMDYTRTWEETAPGPIPRRVQVYRFVVKVDFKDDSGGAPVSPCLLPACFGGHDAAFYYGYLDYAFDCANAQVEAALVLFHNCDEYIHDPASSSRPGAFHPGTMHALVWPHTTANPFVAASLPATTGPMTAEAMRTAPIAPGGSCFTEDRVLQGNVRPRSIGCGCPLAPQPLHTSARDFRGTLACVDATGGTSFFLTVNAAFLPWNYVMANSIGSWTTGASYPGEEQVWVDEGAMVVKDLCAQTLGLPRAYAEVYYGASTAAGWVVTAPFGFLTQNFTDLASNYSHALPGFPPAPYAGAVRPTRNLIYVNTP